ncbi:AI-2E family transporter [Paucilactobacillus wasatchensis]|uniref:Putative membrane protein n=1 Tax=Paucilactobacillus wasatchensis TaxID=1335616 RepID=A0A0D1A769_9LACO|nr:AI-2E family transporter [Paucilactobacillus wasatchensis]KIS03527.1 putative membrane protein [Paucilactobacillus wasatchensis]
MKKKDFSHYRLLFWTLELLAVAALILVSTKIQFIFKPFFTFISVVFVPLIIAGFLFYMLNPLVKMMTKMKIGKFHLNRSISSLLVVLILILIVVGGIGALIPPVVSEIAQLVKSLPDVATNMQSTLTNLINHSFLKDVDLTTYVKKVDSQLGKYAQLFLKELSSSIGNIISTITNVTIITITVPVMLFYMLKDGHRLVPSIQRFVSPKHADEINGLLTRMSSTLSSYISGQVIECLFVAVFTTIGYYIIGQPLALVLGIVAGMANIIPYIGPYIGIAPALMVSLTMAPEKIIWVIVVVIVVQQVDGNIIYPNIIGKSLKIHPLTIIVLLLAAGHIAGIPGMILCIPFYAVIRTMIQYFWSIYQLSRDEIIEEPKKEA